MSRKRRRDSGEPTGNLSWRVETPSGPVLQKVYLARHGAIRGALRTLLMTLFSGKSGASPLARWRTERAVLAHWAELGFDAPRDLSPQFPGLAREGVAVLEFVEGRVLLKLLAATRLARPKRDALLVRFATEWSRRHGAAIDTGDTLLVQEHGGFEHVMVTPDRLVTFDFEQIHRAGRDVRRLVAREVAGYLRSLCKQVPDDVLRADVRALIRGYTRRDILHGVVDEAFRSRNPLRRLMFAFDRRIWRRIVRGGRKYVALAVLDHELRQ